MLVVAIDLQLAEHGLTQAVLWQHANDSFLHDQLRVSGITLWEVFGAQATRIAGVVLILLLFRLRARGFHLRGVDDDDVVASVDKRRITGTFLPHQDMSDLRSQPSEGLPTRIHDEPLARNFPLF